MSLLFKRTMATASSLKQAGKIICVGRNYA